MSQENGIFFDSKAFDRIPSQMHQINSQTGAPVHYNNGSNTNGGPTSGGIAPYSNLPTLTQH